MKVLARLSVPQLHQFTSIYIDDVGGAGEDWCDGGHPPSGHYGAGSGRLTLTCYSITNGHMKYIVIVVQVAESKTEPKQVF